MEANSINNNNLNNIIDIVYLTPANAEFSLSENKFLQLKATVKNPEKKQTGKDGKDNKEKTEVTEEENSAEEIFFERVFLHRAFPFDNPFEYISVSGNFPKPEPEKKDEEKKDDKEKDNKESEGEQNSDSPALSSDSNNSNDSKNSKTKSELKENTTSLGDLKEIGIISNIAVFGEIQQQYLADELKRKYFVPVIEAIYSVKEKYGFSCWEVKTNVGKIKFTVNDAYRNILKVTKDRIMVTDVNGNRYEIISLDGLDRPSFRKIELFL